jgi:hypothetical protein
MKKTLISLFLSTFLFSSAVFAQFGKDSYKPANGYVPDEITALKIAEAVLIPIYGEKQVGQEKPLKAELKEDIWVVEGSMYCPDWALCKAGVAQVKISKDDGTILSVTHGE